MWNQIKAPALERDPLSWITILTLTALAWIPVLQQTWAMFFTGEPLFGTMGLSFIPFLFFWVPMMVAMMFPALAPIASVRTAWLRRQTGRSQAFWHLLIFLLGYLLIWTLFGIPVFFLAWLSERLVLSAPIAGLGLGVGLLIAIGFYQMTPLAKRYLSFCNPTLCCSGQPPSVGARLFPLWDGLRHGLACLGCCGGLMLVLLAVGLMNLPWMVLLTALIFLEKIWQHGDRLGFFIGFGLLIFAVLAFAEPALIPGLVRPT